MKPSDSLNFYLSRNWLSCRLDVYKPIDNDENALYPVGVLVHGGAWCDGSKFQLSEMGDFLANRGCLCVVVGYRTYPEGMILSQITDIQRALAWTAANCIEFNGDKDRITLYGHSSGAHISMMALLHSNSRVGRPDVAAFVGSSGVYDPATHVEFEAWRGVSDLSPMKAAFGGYEGLRRWSPLRTIGKRTWAKTRFRKQTGRIRHFAGKHRETTPRICKPVNFPLVFLQTSTVDATVPWTESMDFHETLGRHGVESHVLIYNGMAHADFIKDFSHLRNSAFRDSLGVLFTSLPHAQARLDQFDAKLPCHIFDLLGIIEST